MSHIMCTGTLLRRLGRRCAARQQTRRLPHGVSLGSWAAKTFVCDGKDLVIALNERTCLTLLFPFPTASAFCANFSRALAQALEDLRLANPVIQAETAAIDLAMLCRLTDRTTIAALNDLQFFAELERSYHEDLRIVQWNLNQIPRANCESCIPIDAVRRLYETGGLGWSSTEH